MKTGFYKILERKLASVSTKIIAISEKQKQELVEEHEICPADKIVVIPLGFDLQRFQDKIDEKRNVFREEFKLDDADIAIAIVGRLVPIKNHRLFLEAFKWVKERSEKRIKAFIVGDGESRQEIEQICTDFRYFLQQRLGR